MDIGFLITTCNRQENCQKLVDILKEYGTVYVLNDGCDYDIAGANQTKLREHLGRAGYWRTVNCLFSGRGTHKYYFMLPDDFLPVPGMVEKAIAVWNTIQNKKKICLNLYADRVGKSCWTNFKSIEFDTYWKTQWVDMCFMCEDKFFLELGTLTEPRSNWNSRGSSGVGAMISKRLFRRGFNLYQVKESLVVPQIEHTQSQMHNDSNRNSVPARPRRTFDTRRK